MSKMMDYIAKRRGEIKELMASLKDELRELDVAEKALSDRNTEKPVSSGNHQSGKKTIKEMVLEVLATQADGATSSQLADYISIMFGIEMERPSLSPQLSRLKDEKYITLDGGIWKISGDQKN